MIDLNELAIRKHYKILNHSNNTEIRVFSNNQTRYTYFVNSEDEFVNTIKQLGITVNIGVGVNERKPEKTDDDSVISLKYLVLDIDDLNASEQFEQFLTKHNIDIYAKIFSGQKGYHYYFKVIPINDNLELREFLLNAKYFFHTLHKQPIDEKCFNASRIFRVWGTSNKGNEVKILYINEDAIPIETDFFPEQPYYLKIERNFIGKHQVIARIKFIDDFLNNKIAMPIMSGTGFNDIFVPNIIAYAVQKNMSLKALLNFASAKKHSRAEIQGWIAKKDTLIFNYAQLRGNIKEFYPNLYNTYFLTETRDFTNNISYSLNNEATSTNYKEIYRNEEYFTITDINTIKGRIIFQSQFIEQMHIGLKYYYKLDESGLIRKPYIMFFDEYVNRNYKPFTKKELNDLGLEPKFFPLKTNFYVYDVLDENNAVYKIYSEQQLDNGDYILHGTRFFIKDLSPMFKTTKQQIDSKLLFLHSFETNQKSFNSFDECYAVVKCGIDDFYQYLLSYKNECYLTSEFFKEIYLSWFFAGRDTDGRPLNIMILGEAGSGKTPQLRAITNRFEEAENSGTKLTINGLIISFYGNTPKPGEFLKSKRVIAIDEFFKMLSNRALDSYEDLSNLNDMLDNNKKNIPNGKFEITAQSKCQLLACSNPIHERFTGSRTIGKRITFSRMCEILPSDFLGRILFLIQTDKEYTALKSGKMIIKNFKAIDIHKDEFTALYDFFNSIKIELTNEQNERLIQITNSVELPDVFKNVYNKSTTRNAELLLCGIVKKRMFTEKSSVIEIKDVDFKMFEYLWKEIHYRWLSTTDMQADPLKFLSEFELEILKRVQENRISFYVAEKGEIKHILNKLTDMGIVERNNKEQYFEYKTAKSELDNLINLK